MKYSEDRNRITIEPMNKVEEAYLEEVFGLKKDGDTCIGIRKNASGLSCWAYLELRPLLEPTPSTLFEHITDSTREKVDAFQFQSGDIAGSMGRKIYSYLCLNCTDIINTYEEELTKRLNLAVKSKDWVAVAALATILEKRL